MKLCAFLFTLLLTFHPKLSLGQAASKGEYMQIFFAGSSWLADHSILQYSPAFKGKREEFVTETEATLQVSPRAFLNGGRTTTSGVSDGATTTILTDENGTYTNGRRLTEAEIAKENRAESERFNRGVAALEARSNLARTALSRALNEVAADGWEVVQMTAYGTQGGLVYLLRRR